MPMASCKYGARIEMTRLATLLLFAAIAYGSLTIVAIADDVPTYDVRATCRGESLQDASAGVTAACLADEQKARETLVTQWTQFAPEARTSCLQLEGDITGVRSYVELLTCLQIAKQAKDLPK
jgi:hypothetical protein